MRNLGSLLRRGQPLAILTSRSRRASYCAAMSGGPPLPSAQRRLQFRRVRCARLSLGRQGGRSSQRRGDCLGTTTACVRKVAQMGSCAAAASACRWPCSMQMLARRRAGRERGKGGHRARWASRPASCSCSRHPVEIRERRGPGLASAGALARSNSLPSAASGRVTTRISLFVGLHSIGACGHGTRTERRTASELRTRYSPSSLLSPGRRSMKRTHFAALALESF